MSTSTVDYTDPDQFGPIVWPALHVVASWFPRNATPAQRQAFRSLLLAFGDIMPCECKERWKTFCSQNSIDKHMNPQQQSPYTLPDWVNNSHNNVNALRDKRQWSIAEVNARYPPIWSLPPPSPQPKAVAAAAVASRTVNSRPASGRTVPARPQAKPQPAAAQVPSAAQKPAAAPAPATAPTSVPVPAKVQSTSATAAPTPAPVAATTSTAAPAQQVASPATAVPSSPPTSAATTPSPAQPSPAAVAARLAAPVRVPSVAAVTPRVMQRRPMSGQQQRMVRGPIMARLSHPALATTATAGTTANFARPVTAAPAVRKGCSCRR